VLAGVHVVRAVALAAGRVDDAVHALMGAGMAAMFAPSLDPLPDWVWVAAFAVTGAWFGAVAVRVGRWSGAPVHHVAGSVAMLVMLTGHSHGVTDAGGEHAGHAVHGGGDDALGWASVASVLLAGWFAWYAWDVVGRRRVAGAVAAAPHDTGGTGTAPGAVAVDRRVSTVLLSADTLRTALVAMAVLMAAMLLGAV
jgi:hypothetical protein